VIWKVIRSSVVGTSRYGHNQPCQDFCIADAVLGDDGEEYLICLVSDGAGSAKEGGKGAELACSTARISIAASLTQPDIIFGSSIVEQWIINVRQAISRMADANADAIRDYACTLIGAVVSHGQSVFFQIGDGAIVASYGYTQGVVFWPDCGPYANMTYFITDEDALQHLHVSITNAQIEELALFSDGLQRLALDFSQRTPHAPFFEPMLETLRKTDDLGCRHLDELLSAFLASPIINGRTDDDKTLILATRRYQ
jgi:hypothetical protein